MPIGSIDIAFPIDCVVATVVGAPQLTPSEEYEARYWKLTGAPLAAVDQAATNPPRPLLASVRSPCGTLVVRVSSVTGLEKAAAPTGSEETL